MESFKERVEDACRIACAEACMSPEPLDHNGTFHTKELLQLRREDPVKFYNTIKDFKVAGTSISFNSFFPKGVETSKAEYL